MSWNDPDREDTTIYKVVMNHEEQYSIWPDYKEIPRGWKDAGKTGPKAECLAFIKEVWTDMRPLSLRKKMEEMANLPPRPVVSDPNAPRPKSLVDRLCEGDHAVELVLRPEKSVKQLKETLDQGFVHVRFTQTKGGTELGFRLNKDASNLNAADFENGRGTVHLEGDLTLDYQKVNCVAHIDVSTLEGKGHLVKLEAQRTSVA